MERETKQHIIYAGIFTLTLVILVFYYNTQITSLKTQINEGFFNLQNNLNSVSQSLAQERALREQSDTDIKEDISGLSSSLDKNKQQLSSLSGDLSSLRTESEKQFSSLEENIKSVKIANQDFSAIIDDVVKSVVGIRTDSKQGSGFFVAPEGYIVTNYHVIQGAQAATILTYDGKNHRVRLVNFDEAADIAVLKIESDYDYLSFTDSDSLEIGQKVIAVGSPGGLDFTVTQGIVSAMRTRNGNTYVQIDVPINPGNSGGALVTIEGEVAGVNSLKLAGFEGVGFALASNQVEDIIDPMIQADKELLASLNP